MLQRERLRASLRELNAESVWVRMWQCVERWCALSWIIAEASLLSCHVMSRCHLRLCHVLPRWFMFCFVLMHTWLLQREHLFKNWLLKVLGANVARRLAFLCFILNNCGGVTFLSCHVVSCHAVTLGFVMFCHVDLCFDAHLTSLQKLFCPLE